MARNKKEIRINAQPWEIYVQTVKRKIIFRYYAIKKE